MEQINLCVARNSRVAQRSAARKLCDRRVQFVRGVARAMVCKVPELFACQVGFVWEGPGWVAYRVLSPRVPPLSTALCTADTATVVERLNEQRSSRTRQPCTSVARLLQHDLVYNPLVRRIRVHGANEPRITHAPPPPLALSRTSVSWSYMIVCRWKSTGRMSSP